ncbi:hypothetical protein MPH_07293 [Macrophomina phaseolina MS6]|uniref:Uncharacterized protein n=1 Tax=Macrophomina phaseolina (strain MS6) TaxID=1126212 RepID=K2QZP1_MACPH|nr:hypothetical protein MPH_07293 [Macrophomina phaseolina MS6]
MLAAAKIKAVLLLLACFYPTIMQGFTSHRSWNPLNMGGPLSMENFLQEYAVGRHEGLCTKGSSASRTNFVFSCLEDASIICEGAWAGIDHTIDNRIPQIPVDSTIVWSADRLEPDLNRSTTMQFLDITFLLLIAQLLQPVLAYKIDATCKDQDAELMRDAIVQAFDMARQSLDALENRRQDVNVKRLIELLFCEEGQDPATIDMTKVMSSFTGILQMEQENPNADTEDTSDEVVSEA